MTACPIRCQTTIDSSETLLTLIGPQVAKAEPMVGERRGMNGIVSLPGADQQPTKL